jgi:hypothetical protein
LSIELSSIIASLSREKTSGAARIAELEEEVVFLKSESYLRAIRDGVTMKTLVQFEILSLILLKGYF